MIKAIQLHKVLRYGVSLFLCFILLSRCGNTISNQEQLNYSVENPEDDFKRLLLTNNLKEGEYQVFFRVFKLEEILEVWVGKPESEFTLLSTYPFCANSGVLGPKRKEGDRQIPEGVYSIDRYNPQSRFHLSLGINYPNSVDLIHANKSKPGSNIFIHGGCASIGCISITDQSIDQVYRLAERSAAPLAIEAHFFPFKFDKVNLQEELENQNGNTQKLWESLEPIFYAFEQTKRVPKVQLKNGLYLLVN